MSEYIRCPKCLEDTLDVDCLRCDCGYSANVGPARVFADADNNGLNARVLPAPPSSNLESLRVTLSEWDQLKAPFGSADRATRIDMALTDRAQALGKIIAAARVVAVADETPVKPTAQPGRCKSMHTVQCQAEVGHDGDHLHNLVGWRDEPAQAKTTKAPTDGEPVLATAKSSHGSGC